jgi:mannose-6-phosphate isomerase-like protein (cupin superfamily)
MRTIIGNFIIAAASLIPFVALGQSGSTKPATYITREEIDTVNKQPGGDRQIKVVDIGSENFAVGVVHRGATQPPAARGAGGGAARQNAPAAEPCGEKSATPPPAGTPNALTHDQQTEGYYIISGGGTMVTGGHLVNGRKSAPDSAVTRELNGPSCSGPVVGPDVVTREVKVGDIIIIPAGTPHGWVNIPDHVDYLSFRPSARVLTAGYVHPAIKK